MPVGVGPPVAGTKRRGGLDECYGHALGRGPQNLMFGDVLGLLVPTEKVAHIGKRRVSSTGRAISVPSSPRVATVLVQATRSVPAAAGCRP